MSRRSRNRRKKRVQSIPRPLVTHKSELELRSSAPRRELPRERRQFVPNMVKEFDDEFTSRNAQEVPARVDSVPARRGKRLSAPASLARDDYLRESYVPSLHDYFQERPEQVAPCVHRRQRRAVLFALRRTAKGSGAGKPHFWTEESKIRCS